MNNLYNIYFYKIQFLHISFNTFKPILYDIAVTIEHTKLNKQKFEQLNTLLLIKNFYIRN